MIYRGICSCGADYIGETIRNFEMRWNEHLTGKCKNLPFVKHLNDNFDHEFWIVYFSRCLQNPFKT